MPSKPAHWMTITEFVVDDITGEKWMTVQNWGDKEYINFDQWIENQYGTLADGLLVITKGR